MSIILAIGNFDGVHKGHQQIIKKATELLTFEPYPQEFFNTTLSRVVRLTSLAEKKRLCQNYNHILIMHILEFNQAFSELSPEQFIKEIMIKKYHPDKIIIGHDFRFGHRRQGGAELLNQFIPTEMMEPVMYQERRISSTWVRECLAKGDLALAKNLLGRSYSMSGRVVRGDGRGRQLGFATANISLDARLPALKGVYAVTIAFPEKSEKIYRGMANIGTRPTVDGTRLFLEVHLFDFNKDIYGEWIDISFKAKIRDEQKFNSVPELQAQLLKDSEMARIEDSSE